MKLKVIAEGLSIKDEGGRKVIDYHDDGKPDDKYFKQKVDGKDQMTSSKLAKPTKTGNWVDLMKDNVSSSEIDELESHNKTKPGAYQTGGMDKYTAMPINSFQEFLDALKQRNEENITMADGALERLSIRGAKSTADALSSKLNQFKFFKHIVIIPLPSSHKLSKMYAHHVAEEVRKRHADVQVVETLLTKSDSPKIGSHLRGGDKEQAQDKGVMFKDRPTKYFKDSHDMIMKHYSPEQLEQYYETRIGNIAHLITKLKSGTQTDHTKSQIKGLEEERIHLKTLEDKMMDKMTSPANKNNTMKISNVFGAGKRLAYDRFHAADENMPERKGPTLVILTDDNIDSNSSIIDAYRVLFKKGLVHSKNDKVVALALHRLGVIK